MMSRKQYSIIVSYGILMCVMLGVWFWMSSADALTDDWWYQYEFDYCSYEEALEGFENCDGDEITLWSQVWESIKHHNRYWNNNRLANTLMFVLTMMPNWFVDAIHVLMWMLMILFILKQASDDWWLQPLFVVGVLWSVWIILPWHDQMASGNYQINYVWSTALNLVFLYSFNRADKSLVGCLIAFPASLMHEGFSVPISIGVLYVLYQRVKNDKTMLSDKKMLLSIVLYLVGTLLVVFGPAIQNRFANIGANEETFTFNAFVYKFFIREPILFLSLGLIGVYAIKCGFKSLRGVLRTEALWITIALTSMLIWMLIDGTERQMWIGYVAFIVFDWRLIARLTCRNKINSIVVSTIALILGLLQMLWLLKIADYQKKACEEIVRIEKAMKSMVSELLYVDTYSPSWLPWWVLDIPEYYHGRNPQLRAEHYAWQRRGWNEAMITLPQKYQGLDYDSLPVIEGTASLRGVFPFYYSSIKYGDDEGFARFIVKFDGVEPSEYLNRAYLIYRLPQFAKELTMDNGQKQGEYVFKRVAVVKERGDTSWFYRVRKIGQSVRGCRVISIDTIS